MIASRVDYTKQTSILFLLVTHLLFVRSQFQTVRTTLLSGLLKVLSSNKQHTLPMRIFEVRLLLLSFFFLAIMRSVCIWEIVAQAV